MGPIISISFWVAIASLNVPRFYNVIGYPGKYSILPFQAGILYRRGLPARQVGPGRHWVFLGTEKIIFLDTRPILESSERRGVTLMDGAFAVYGFTASAEVSDASKAMYSSANYTQIPAFITRTVARGILSQCEMDQLNSGRSALEEQVVSTCRSRLADAGFKLLFFRFTELAIHTPTRTTL